MSASDWKAQAEEKRASLMESITTAIQALADETDAVRAGEALERYLAAMSQFHQYSLHNQILIGLQKPDATLVAGFHTWQEKFGRWVKKGERGIAILAPRLLALREAPEEAAAPEHSQLGKPLPQREVGNPERRQRVIFATVYVFDVSQTEGTDLPDELAWREREKDEPVEKALGAFAHSRGIEIEIVDSLGNAEGRAREGALQLKPESGTHTFVHELAHVLYEHSKSEVRKRTTRQQREIEADAAAHVVCKYFGLSSLSPNYLALWEVSKEDIMACLERVRAVAVEIITGVEDSLKGDWVDRSDG